MTANIPIISLCIPTNGIIEWVIPALDSIYSQNVDSALYEVIVTDNGNNEEFQKAMNIYVQKHRNLIYRKTNAYMFDNQLEALKLANGLYFKFINHRSLLEENALSHFIEIITKYKDEKPVLYFACGVLRNKFYELNCFDEFVKVLKRYASWTTGVGMWKEDYEKLPKNLVYDKISPHSVLLFSERHKSKYIIDNFVFSHEISANHRKKGTYDLFKAFGIEELTITLKLFIDGDISIKTLKAVKKDYKKFLAELYWSFCIRKQSCSYDLTGFNDSMGIFFSKINIVLCSYGYGFLSLLRFIKRLIIKRK